jgi:hypothetical protein
LGVTEETLKPFLEGWTVQQVIKSNRLFLVDLKIMKGIPVKSEEFIVSFR